LELPFGSLLGPKANRPHSARGLGQWPAGEPARRIVSGQRALTSQPLAASIGQAFGKLLASFWRALGKLWAAHEPPETVAGRPLDCSLAARPIPLGASTAAPKAAPKAAPLGTYIFFIIIFNFAILHSPKVEPFLPTLSRLSLASFRPLWAPRPHNRLRQSGPTWSVGGPIFRPQTATKAPHFQPRSLGGARRLLSRLIRRGRGLGSITFGPVFIWPDRPRRASQPPSSGTHH